MAAAAQEVTGDAVESAYVDQGCTGAAAEAAAAHGIGLVGVKLPRAKGGFVLPPRRWVVGRPFRRAARFRRLAGDYERLAATLAGLHYVAFAILMLHEAASLLSNSSQHPLGPVTSVTVS